MLLDPILSADPSAFQNGRDPSWPTIDETLQFREDGTPEWWPTTRDLQHDAMLSALGRRSWTSQAERRASLLRNLRESLPTSLTTPQTNAEQQQLVDTLRRTYAGLLSGASDILS